MATIESLGKSISDMSTPELNDRLMKIRAQRRLKPEKKKPQRNARTAKKPSKKAPKQQDLFVAAKGMTSKQKADLLKALLGG